MTITALLIAAGTGTGGAQTYTVPANTTWVVKRATFNNTTGGALTFTVSYNDGTTDREIDTNHSLASEQNDICNPLTGLTLIAGQAFSINAAVGITFAVSGVAIV